MNAFKFTIISIAVLALLPSCRADRLSTTEKSKSTETAVSAPLKPKSESAESIRPTRAKIDTEWHHAMDLNVQHPERFERAYELLKTSLPKSEHITLKSSMCLGDWCVLETNPPEIADGEVTVQVKQHYGHIIDTAEGHVVNTDDWRYALPFFQDISQKASAMPSIMTPEFVLGTARFAAALAAENTPVFIPESGKTYPADISSPKMRIQNGELSLTWYSSNMADPPMYIRYQIDVSKIITFKSEIVDIKSDEPIVHTL